jgi:hypothetical protein
MSNPLITAIENDLEALKNWLEADASSALAFLLSFTKEFVSEEEAALFPAFKAQVVKLFNDEAAMQGLDVQARVTLAVTEATVDLAADVVLAKNALFNSWAWAIAHQQGIVNGNQGVLPSGTDTTPAA